MSAFCSKLRQYDTCISSAALQFCAQRQGGLCNQIGWDKGTILGRLPLFASEERKGHLASSSEYIKNSVANGLDNHIWRSVKTFVLGVRLRMHHSIYFLHFYAQVSLIAEEGRKLHLFPKIPQGVPKQNNICNPLLCSGPAPGYSLPANANMGKYFGPSRSSYWTTSADLLIVDSIVL